jgi:hypothetical protein
MAARVTATTSAERADSQQGGDLSTGSTGVAYKSGPANYGAILLETAKQVISVVKTGGIANALQMASNIDAAENSSARNSHTVTDEPAVPATTPVPTHQAPPPGGFVPDGSAPNPGAATVVSSGTSKGVLWVIAVAVVLIMAIVVKDD